MKRVKWLRFSLKGGLRVLENKLHAKLFLLSDPVSSGFRVEERTTFGIKGQFISKRTVDQRFLLPSGEEFFQEVATFEITKFGFDLRGDTGLLSIIDPPRSTVPFLSALSESTNFTCMIDPIEVDVVLWIDLLLKSVPGSVVTYADVAGISVNDEVQGRVALASRNGATVDPVLFMSFGSGGKVESARVRLAVQPEGEIVEISSRGTVKVTNKFSISELKMLRDAMLRASALNESDLILPLD